MRLTTAPLFATPKEDMIDWHCHILPGLDDGPETMVESLAMARLLSAAGFRVVHCTPHCNFNRYDNSPDQVRRLVERMQRYLHVAGIPLLLKAGMEYCLDEHFPMLQDLQPLGDSRLLLVEIPSGAGVDMVLENVNLAIQRGFTPLFAHPERCSLLNEELGRRSRGMLKNRMKRLFGKIPGRAAPICVSCQDLRQGLLEMGCLFQGNIGSFSGWYGSEVRQEALHYLTAGFYSRLGSDGHGFRSLEMTLCPGMAFLEELPEGGALLRRPLPSGVFLGGNINKRGTFNESDML